MLQGITLFGSVSLYAIRGCVRNIADQEKIRTGKDIYIASYIAIAYNIFAVTHG